jgi:RIO-like serine/threonine protein kinase
VGTEDGISYIVGELVDGTPLRDARFSLNKTLDIAIQILSGLAAAHDAGIVHRDLKPDTFYSPATVALRFWTSDWPWSVRNPQPLPKLSPCEPHRGS